VIKLRKHNANGASRFLAWCKELDSPGSKFTQISGCSGIRSPLYGDFHEQMF
jgi:hypothetical protein